MVLLLAASLGACTDDDPEGVQPGQACQLGSSPDCIDPEGDGAGTYLTGGAQCMKDLGASRAMCADLDGDGEAGYPDSG